jgi:hypothetical protein
MKFFPLIPRFLLALCLTAAPLAAADNLIQNGELSFDESSKQVTSWRIAPENTNVESADDKPADIAKALAITIGEVTGNDGAMTQRIAVPAATKLKLTGWVRADKTGAGYIAIKLFKGKEELKRVKLGEAATSDWVKVEQEFETEGADKLEVLCRWSQNGRHQGTRVYFADIQLTPAS